MRKVTPLSSKDDADSTELGLLGRTIHSFIVKIWREADENGVQTTWQGHITHVPDKERRHLRSLEDITLFIEPYIRNMGVTLDPGWKLRDWLRQRKNRDLGAFPEPVFGSPSRRSGWENRYELR